VVKVPWLTFCLSGHRFAIAAAALPASFGRRCLSGVEVAMILLDPALLIWYDSTRQGILLQYRF